MVNKILSNSRFIILIAVACAFIAAVALLILAGVETIQLIINAFSINLDVKEIKLYAVRFIEVIDILLLSTVFYITALGLYELFIDDRLVMPDWLHITQLDDLKYKLIDVLVVILVVVFLEKVVTWEGNRDIFFLGAAIALVITAITYFIGRKERNKEINESES